MADGCYKIRLKAAPVDGKANRELLKWLAKQFGVSGADVVIKTGLASRSKSVEIRNTLLKLKPDWFYE